MPSLLLLSIALASQIQAPTAASRAEALGAAAHMPAGDAALARPQVTLEHTLGWVGIIDEDGRAVARELETGREVVSDEDGACVEFRPGHAEVWFGRAVDGAPSPGELERGALVKVGLDGAGSPTRVRLATDEEPLEAVEQVQFSADGLTVGVRSSESRVVRILRRESTREGTGETWRTIARVEQVVTPSLGAPHVPPYQFLDSAGTMLVYTRGSHSREGQADQRSDGGVVVALAEPLDELLTFRPYLGKASRGFVVVDGRVVYASRAEWNRWRLTSRGVEVGDVTRVIDADARGGHFCDLFVDSTGRWLVEGDFEDDSPRIYDLQEYVETDGTARWRELPPKSGRFCGFDRAGSPESPLVFVGAGHGTSLAAFQVDGDIQQRSIGALESALPEGARVVQVETTVDGRYMVVSFAVANVERHRSRYGLRVLRVED